MQSMTGYGRAEASIDNMDISVEIKSVNHRYADFNIRVPRYYGFLEGRVKKHLQNYVARGKVDVYVSVNNRRDDSKKVLINNALAGEYISSLRDVAKAYGLDGDVEIATLARFNEIFDVEYKEQDEETLFEAVLPVLDEAAKKFVDMRTREGEKLTQDMRMHRNLIEEQLVIAEELSPRSVDAYKEKLTSRIEEIMADITIDESRIMTEIAILADKLCVTEETVRLRSHFKEFDMILAKNEAAGRKLDFLIQEMNREVNTLGNKANDLDMSRCVVEMKTELEKIREQLQNLE